MDYWAIALSSVALMRSVFPGSTRKTTALALAATPINPLAVSTVNAIAMEVHSPSSILLIHRLQFLKSHFDFLFH